MDFADYLRFVVALLFVLGLIGGLALVARHFGMMPRAAKPNRGGTRRLGIVEVANVDGKRRLVLIRRDQVEHLVLLGMASETVIERGIRPPAAPGADPDPDPEGAE